jgi:Mg-chelatase subunit ChlI
LIGHVIATASTELSRGVLDLGIASPLLDRFHSQLDVQHLLQLNDEAQAAAAAVAPPPVPPGFATPAAAAAFALRSDGEFEQCALSLTAGVAAAHAESFRQAN